jgi:hypothetical protein
MTRDKRRNEIMGMGDRELYEGVIRFLHPRKKVIVNIVDAWILNGALALWGCWKAEEKIKEMGLGAKYAEELYNIMGRGLFRGDVIENVLFYLFFHYHAHPRDRAKAILLTIEEVER